MPPRSPTTVGMAVDTTVISMAAIDRLSSRATTVSGRLVFIAVDDALTRLPRRRPVIRKGGCGNPSRATERRRPAVRTGVRVEGQVGIRPRVHGTVPAGIDVRAETARRAAGTPARRGRRDPPLLCRPPHPAGGGARRPVRRALAHAPRLQPQFAK